MDSGRELADLNLEDYQAAAQDLIDNLKGQLGGYYYTRCNICGNEQVPVKYYLWVKTLTCEDCGQVFDLFPGYTLASNNRHPNYVLICSSCGQLNEVEEHNNPCLCADCGQQLIKSGPASRNRCLCPNCGTSNRYPRPELGPLQHRMVAIEYYCPQCKPNHRGRFFKRPDQEDLDNYKRAEQQFLALDSIYVPREFIPPGDESTRLHRWGYTRYQELFNSRQLLGLELSSRLIMALPEGEVKSALATNLSDLLRYQNMLCRYDTRALKSLDIFSVHGFPVSLLQCESNLLGIVDEERRGNIGSGGWTNIVDKYLRAKEYCQEPFEIKHVKGKKIQVPISGEKIGPQPRSNCSSDSLDYQLYCQSSTDLSLPAASLDAVITDPPYFGNVQYAELMDFCYVWLRKLAGTDYAGFGSNTTRDKNELTGNTTMKRGSQHLLEGISQVFQNMARALKPGAPFVFTYHHNDIKAYLPVAVALLDAGLVCSASLPCPGEMGASIHINGTGSSIIDTIFVCRSTGVVSSRTIVGNPKDIARLVEWDLKQLVLGGVKFSQGDMRCIKHCRPKGIPIMVKHKSRPDKAHKIAAIIPPIRSQIILPMKFILSLLPQLFPWIQFNVLFASPL